MAAIELSHATAKACYMKRIKTNCCIILMLLTAGNLPAQLTNTWPDEHYRPKVHFTPAQHWMNDPNGMVYHEGIYHLFFQYHPHSNVWGPMHWGHATSTNMINWKHQPIALYPDSLGTIFSGSAVVDKTNTSGFGKNGKAPLVAIYTYHNPAGEKAGRNDFQYQGIAYSNDNGSSWTKYAGNPVLKNPGIIDFRDPKVMWYAPQKKWVMTLAMKDRIGFYSSPNLKDWKKESEFGATLGAHGGVWECPDLVSLNDNGKERWVLIVNLNPGAPNGGSGTQYFVGDFDGSTFSTDQQDTKWLDYGPDNYAGITWSNTGSRKTLIGWMSNWMYATQVPTETWRSALTLPRDLTLKHVGNSTYVASTLVPELKAIQEKPKTIQPVMVASTLNITNQIGPLQTPCRIELAAGELKDFTFELSNGAGETLLVGYDDKLQQYFIDRSKSGKTDFNTGFSGRHVAPRLSTSKKLQLSLVLDASSVELFADDGLTVMTSIFFPAKPYTKLQLAAPQPIRFSSLSYSRLKPIW